MADSSLCSYSHWMTRGLGRGLVGSETMLVSSRYFTDYNDTSRPGDLSRTSWNNSLGLMSSATRS